MTDILRTKRDGCYQVRSNSWGAFLVSVDDPQANGELEEGALKRFELHDGITPIPADLWSRWVALCFHFAHLKQGDLEVSCRLLRKEDDRNQWRILIPRQEVSGASVRIDSFDEAIDIATGELVASYPPDGWVPAGSSHSHNTMQMASFSSVDDASELGCPGLHIVLSHIDVEQRTYRCTASVTANHRRFYLPDAAAVVDLKPLEQPFHPAVLEVVQPERPRALLPLWRTAERPGSTRRQELVDWGLPLPPRKASARERNRHVDDDYGAQHDAALDQVRELLTSATTTLADDSCEQLLLAVSDMAAEMLDDIFSISSSWHIHDDDDTADTRAGTCGTAPSAASGLPTGEW